MTNQLITVSFPIEKELKEQADALFDRLGFNLNTAFNIFIHKALEEGGIPFSVTVDRPNEETIAAMLEAERISHDPNVKGYTNLDELFEDLDNE